MRPALLLAVALPALYAGAATAQLRYDHRPSAVQATEPDASNPSFNLVNGSLNPIRAVHVSPSWAEDWGDNVLRQNRRIAVGGVYPVRMDEDGECQNDVKVVFADGKVEEARGINTCSVASVTVTGAGDLQQETRRAAGGQDRKSSPYQATADAARQIKPGAVPGVDRTGSSVASIPAESVPQPRVRTGRVTLTNGGAVPLTQIFVAPSLDPMAGAIGAAGITWGDNRVGAAPLQPGRSLVVNLPSTGPCRYDIRLRYADDRTDGRRINACSAGEVVLP